MARERRSTTSSADGSEPETSAWYIARVVRDARRRWTREELLLALHLYTRISFGQQHARNPQVIALAAALDRSASSVAMKLNNFTSLDPAERERGVKGLQGASVLDAEVWREFESRRVDVATESEALWQSRVEKTPSDSNAPDIARSAPRLTETLAARRVRLSQDYFRRVVLENFGGRCALTGITHPALLNASHIVPWASDEAHRLDPANGIALNRLHDAAFDRALITFDENLRLVVGRGVREAFTRQDAASFFDVEGRPLEAPLRHEISARFLAEHREAFIRANR